MIFRFNNLVTPFWEIRAVEVGEKAFTGTSFAHFQDKFDDFGLVELAESLYEYPGHTQEEVREFLNELGFTEVTENNIEEYHKLVKDIQENNV